MEAGASGRTLNRVCALRKRMFQRAAGARLCADRRIPASAARTARTVFMRGFEVGAVKRTTTVPCPTGQNTRTARATLALAIE